MLKRGHKLKTSPLIKDPQFSSNLADIQAKLPTHVLVILTKFHKDCKKIIDFLLRQRILAFALFYASPFIAFQCSDIWNLIEHRKGTPNISYLHVNAHNHEVSTHSQNQGRPKSHNTCQNVLIYGIKILSKVQRFEIISVQCFLRIQTR